MRPLDLPALTAEQIEAVATLYRTTHSVRRRPRSLNLPYSTWTLQRLAEVLAERHRASAEIHCKGAQKGLADARDSRSRIG
jgi:hypothetical protein